MGRAGHLPGEPWSLAPDEGGWPAGWKVRRVDETGSTNADLLAVADVAPDRTVLATGHQTAGRGRLDRRWDAPPGTNLLVSMLFRMVPDDASELPRRVALAASDAARATAGVDAVLKWPNDLLVAGEKLGGVLAQRSSSGAVVVGLGLNVGWAPDGATRLGDGVSVSDVLAELLRAFDALPDDIGERYRSRLATLGQRVRVELTGETLVGTAVDVDADGHLVVLDECAISHRVAVGDVIHLRPT